MRVLLWSALLALVACGGDAEPTVTSVDQASAVVTETNSYATAAAEGAGADAAAALVALGLAAQAIERSPHELGLPGVGTSPEPFPGVGTSPDTFPAAGICMCTATGCAFAGCTDGSTFIVDGSVSITGAVHRLDLDLAVTDRGINWSWPLTGDVRIGAGAIQGRLQVTGHGVDPVDPDAAYSSDWAVEYQAVELDGDGCPTGGQLTADRSYEADSGEFAGRWAGRGTITFGPACGQVAEAL